MKEIQSPKALSPAPGWGMFATGGAADWKIGTFSDALMAEAKQKKLGRDQREKRRETHLPVQEVKTLRTGISRPILLIPEKGVA